MLSEKRWIKLWILLTLFIPLIALFNYIIDPNGMNNKVHIPGVNVFKKTNTGYSYRFKLNSLIDNEYDTLMLGTSRIGVMNPEVVSHYTKGKTFNLEAPASITEIHYKLFMYALKYNNIKNLVYGIDFMAFNRSRTLKKTYPQFNQLNNRIINKEKVSNYDLYFNLDTTESSFTVLYKNLMNKEIVTDRYLNNGMRVFYPYIDRVKKGTYSFDKRLHYSFHEYYNRVNGIYKDYKFSKEYLYYFSKIIEECKARNIKVWVYIPPMYSSFFDSISAVGYFDEFEKFKRELVKVTNYIDFTGHNTITNNKDNYWDGSHLRVKITSQIMARVFNDNSVDVPSDFGVFVTKENIEKHLKNLRAQVKDLNVTKILSY